MKKIISLLSSTYFIFFLVIFIGASLEYRIESDIPGASICTYGDALWFAINVSSVGDASCTPITPAGRLVGAGLILIGYALFTVNVAVLSSALTHYLNKNK